ncbi:MAG: nitroreductase family protein [Clostridia bacterium]|nr:nitroreductase family protein [Clostridia bacterium]
MSFTELAKSRYSVRAFSPKPVEREKLEKIVEAGRIAPTAKNQQPQKVWIAQSPEALEKLNAVSPCIYGATTVLVVGYDKERMWVHPDHEEIHSGYVDASIVLTHMMLEAADQGLGTCWVARFDPYEAEKALGLPENIRLVALMPVGYPAEGAAPSPRHESFRPDAEWLGEL